MALGVAAALLTAAACAEQGRGGMLHALGQTSAVRKARSWAARDGRTDPRVAARGGAARPPYAAAPSWSRLFDRRERLATPVHQLQLDGMELGPSAAELAQMAREAGVLGLARAPSEEQLQAVVARVRAWYDSREYPALGAAATVQRDGVVRVRVRAAQTAREPLVLVFKDQRGAPSAKAGRTRARTVSDALGLRAGAPFKVSGAGFQRLLGPASPFLGVADPQIRLTPDGDAQLVLSVCERNATEIAPTFGIRGSQWYASLSASNANLRGRNQRLALELSKYNASSASLAFDDPRLGRKLGWGANLWADNVRPALFENVPGFRNIGGQIALLGAGEGEAEEGEAGAIYRARRVELARAGLTLRLDARREARWRLQFIATAEKVSERAEGGPAESGVEAAFERARAAAPVAPPALDLPVTLTAKAISQGGGPLQQLSFARTLPLHPRCPDYAALDYRVRAEGRTALPRLSTRAAASLSLASAGQPAYLMKALGGSSTVRGMSHGELGLARALAAVRAEARVQIGGKRAGDSILFGALFSDAAAGLVVSDEPPPAEPSSAARGAAKRAAAAEDYAATLPLRPAMGACVGVGLLVGPIRFEYTLASNGKFRKTLGIDS